MAKRKAVKVDAKLMEGVGKLADAFLAKMKAQIMAEIEEEVSRLPDLNTPTFADYVLGSILLNLFDGGPVAEEVSRAAWDRISKLPPAEQPHVLIWPGNDRIYSPYEEDLITEVAQEARKECTAQFQEAIAEPGDHMDTMRELFSLLRQRTTQPVAQA